MKSNKVGIASYWDSMTNYGQIFQGVALQHVLREMGYAPFTIRYSMLGELLDKSLFERLQDWWNDDVGLSQRVLRRVKNAFSKADAVPVIKPDQRGRRFEEFKRDFLKLSEHSYHTFADLSTEELRECIAFVAGSDQVWHASSGPNRRKYLLLEFAGDGQKKIAYAASFGRNTIVNKKEWMEYHQELPKFDSISVREDSGVQLCKQLGASAISLCDPTLLMDREQWLNFLGISLPSRKRKSVFFYTLKAHHHLASKILELFSEMGYEYNYVCSDDNEDDELATAKATPREWISMLAESSMVVTTSFHGTVFALNFNVPVVSIGNSGELNAGANQRMYSVMNKLGLLEFFINQYDKGAIVALMSKSIDWEYVNDIFRAERSRGIRFLADALK